MLKRVIFTIVLISLFFSVNTFADTVYLKNGNRVSGIILKENDDCIEIKINIGAIVTFSRDDIERIERDSDDEHARIKDRWEAEKTKREIVKTEEDTFYKVQKEKGLVEYEGEWVTPEEREELQTKTLAKDIGKRYDEKFLYKKDGVKRSSNAEILLSKGDWFIRETEHFSIFYKEPNQAKIISDKAEYYFEKIAYDLGYEDDIDWKKKCQVYIVDTFDRWRDFLADIGFNTDFVGGFVPNYKEREMFLWAVSEVYLATTFPHELTHLIFADIAGDSTIPLWLNEGLANYEASIMSISNEFLIKRIKQGRHILLGDLLRMTNYPEGEALRELFYAQSEKLVEFLITQYGRRKFRAFCESVLKDRSFKKSLFNVYRGDFKDIEDFNIKLVKYIVE